MQAEAQKQIEEVLLPQQRDRLRQVARHVEMQRGGDSAGLLQGKLAEELGITPAQKARLEEKAKQIETELAEEIVRLKSQARKDLIAELTPEQQKKLQELLGDGFDYQPTDWRQRLRQVERRARP